MGYSEDEFNYRLWDLVDKKVVRSRDIVFTEDKKIEDSKHQQSGLSPWSTPNTRLVNSTQWTIRRQLVATTKYETIKSVQPTNTYELASIELQEMIEPYESESVELQQPTNMHEPEPK